jgi:D-sedoheptulose 7-phosphate isomerase
VKKIKEIIKESILVKEKILRDEALLRKIKEVAEAIVKCYRGDGSVYLFGNGGSAADSQHIAAELVGRFEKKRKAFNAEALTTDSSILTACGNDNGFETVFERQVEAKAKPRDVVIGISTSGNSANVIRGLQKAKESGAVTVALTGNSGGEVSKIAQYSIIVPSAVTARIQESHIMIGHILCKHVEDSLG